MKNKLAITLIIITAFLAGQAYQFKVDENAVNEALEWSATCDLQTNGQYPNLPAIIEVDCLTPDSYRIINNHFFNSPISDHNIGNTGGIF